MDKNIKIALILTAVDKLSGIVDKSVSKAAKSIQGLNSFGNTAGLIGGAITGIVGKSVGDARESVIATKRLEQVYKSMGDQTGVAAKAAEDYASKLEFQIGVEDETIMAAQAKIATFKDVSSTTARLAGITDRATQAAFDMSATGFGEATDTAVQLSKALQDPIRGITALRRSGITFTEAEQKKIKTMVQSNHLLDAQKLILSAVEKQVGGVAAATADPLLKMKIGWTEISESIGKLVLPYLQQFATWVSTFIPKLQGWIENNGRLIKAIAGVGAALMVVGTISKVVAAIMATNPVTLIIMGIATAAVLIITYWTPIKEFFIKLWSNITAIFTRAWDFIKGIFLKYTPTGLIISNWSKITAFFSGLWQRVQSIFANVWAAIKSIFLNYTPTGLIISNWSKITDFFYNLWEKVKGIFTAAWQWIASLGTKFFDAGSNIISSIYDGIKSTINKPIEAVQDMVQKIRNYLPFSPAKIGPLKDLNRVKISETIAQSVKINPITQAMQRVGNAVINGVSGNALQPAASVNNAGNTYNFHFTLNGSASQSDVTMITDSFKKNVLNILKQEDARKMRVSFNS